MHALCCICSRQKVADFVAEVGEDVGVGGRDGFQVSVRPFSPHAPVGAAALTL